MKSMLKGGFAVAIATLTTLSVYSQTPAMNYPETKKVDQVDTYFGTQVSDPYRWLENDTAQEVKEWVEKQNEVTENYLAKIPFRSEIYASIKSVINYEKYSSPVKLGIFYLFNKNDGLQNQSVTYIQKGLEGTEDEFINPNKMSTDGTAAVSILGFSKDKQFIAYGVNESGSDWQRIEVMSLENRTKTSDNLKWVKFSGASWAGEGFYYSRYPEQEDAEQMSKKNEYHQIYYHRMFTEQEEDQLVFQDKQFPLRYYGTQVTEDERYLFIYVSEGTYGTQILYKDLRDPAAEFKTLVKGFSNNFSIVDSRGSKILLLTDLGAANNHLVSVDLDKFNPEKSFKSQMKEVVKENKSLLESVSSAGGKLFLNYLQDVANHVYQYTFEGVLENEILMPAPGTVSGFSGFMDDNEVFYTFTSFTYPPTIYRYDIATKKSFIFRQSKVAFNPEDYTTDQVFYTSKDGTKIPMFLTYKKGMVKDGSNPTLLYGYGGFNVNLTPSFSASRIVFLANGGIFAMANIRGGGEYGDAWHKAGMLEKKQNVFNDFIAAAEYLNKNKYSSPSKLACMGGSNGGLLIGAVINQRPDLFKVAFPQVGVMDMLRFQKFTVGWGWVVEYGSSDKEADFKNLYKYSPLHNITDKSYPATMVSTADHDDRVVPAHSFKYIATLQEHQKGPLPTLIRVDVKAGHGAGKPLTKVMSEYADIYSFLFYNMGITPTFNAK
ncbi:prolyl oligopeptidase family serine peptidase [soil metagenome]